MPFGISFGANKGRTTQSVSGTENVTGSRSTNTQTNNTQTTSGSTQNWGSNDSFSNTASSATGATTNTGQSNTQEASTTQQFRDPILNSLESLVGQMLSSASSESGGYTSGFDPEAFVRNGMQAATARTQTQIDESTGGIRDAVGGKNNSAVALLEGRLNNDATASLAGTNANLTAQAEEIMRNAALTGVQVAQGQSGILNDALATLRGAITTQSGTGTTSTSEAGTSTQAQTGSATGGERTSSLTEQTTVESLISMISELLSSNQTTNSAGYTAGTSSKMGGGVSASL